MMSGLLKRKILAYLMMFHGWIYNHIFSLEESVSSNKRKRGPRNLTTKVNRKGKSTITANDNEIEDMVEYVGKSMKLAPRECYIRGRRLPK